ncbi:tetratricopeptide repeat protein, partial [Hydrogenophaga sp.]|uniref:tetratricopeptide repeat protein n=1 Tax=Hydrogenophaga sp. TaxID=1904254 RepID=UPI00169AE200
EQAVVTDSSAAALRRLGDLQSANGNRADALRTYERAAREPDGDGALAEHRRARLLIRMGRHAEGYRALAAFADHHPDHADAPLAMYVVGDWHYDARRGHQGDSVFAALAAGWPTSA